MKINIWWLMVTLFLSNSIYSQSTTERISGLDAYIEAARVQWKTPGLGVAVVKDGEILLSKGYGECEIGTGRMVDDHTIFSIGSTTKAMTAAAVAMLVDEGHVSWDDLVSAHIPEFKLWDPLATKELKVRDLFTHNAGLGNGDLLWSIWGYSTEDILKRMAYLEPSYSFRGGYTYQNLMYATAGILVERLSGMEWSTFIRKRIFEPLGMSNSFPLRSEAFTYENRSTPHYYYNEEVRPIADSNADSIGAAGSIWSCTSDMVKWMNFVLDSARINGERLISASSFEELHRPQVIIPKSSFYPTAKLTNPHWTTYSLGWFQHDYKGEFVHFHTGSLNGTVAIIGLLPDHNLGVYVFGNLDHTEVRHAIMYTVFDLFTNKKHSDWSTEFLNLYDGLKTEQLQNQNEVLNSRVEGTEPSLEIEEYAGTYSNDFLGELIIARTEKGLTVNFRPDRNMTLEHWHYDTFLGKFEEFPFDSGSLVDFNLDARGRLSLEIFGKMFRRNN